VAEDPDVEWHDRPDGRAALEDIGQRIAIRSALKGKAEAERIGPVDTGRYVSRFTVRPITKYGIKGARLANDARDPTSGYLYPLVIEFGSENVPAQRILARSVNAMRVSTS
jgi:hypothetical protein